jgi:hypothetical protein
VAEPTRPSGSGGTPRTCSCQCRHINPTSLETDYLITRLAMQLARGVEHVCEFSMKSRRLPSALCRGCRLQWKYPGTAKRYGYNAR